MKTKLVYIVSDIDKALAFEWIAKRLDREKFDITFYLLNNQTSHLEGFLKEEGIQFVRIPYQTSWRLVFPLVQVWIKLLFSRPKIIHTHLRYASLVGITAGFLTGIKTRIHTRHHSTSNHRYFPHAVKTDRIISKLSTKIVSISDVVTDTLVRLEKTPHRKVIKIPHGFDLEYFSKADNQRVNGLREKYGLEDKKPIIGVISRYLELKGIEYGIEAFRRVKKVYPNAQLVLANAKGPYEKVIKDYLKTLPKESYVEVSFENDLASLYGLFDVFLHLPIASDVEAFGQTYVEALAAGVPSVFTISGVAGELIKDEGNALVVPYKDAENTSLAILNILGDENLRNRLISNGMESVTKYNLNSFIARLEKLYTIG